MLIKTESKMLGSNYLMYSKLSANRNSVFNHGNNSPPMRDEYEEEEEKELEIDLDYNEYVEVDIKEEDEPLDLSMKTLSKRHQNSPLDLHKPKLPRLELKPNFKLFNLETKKELLTPPATPAPSEPESPSSGGSFMKEWEVTQLLEPYVKLVQKKFLCTVCDMKFANKVKATTHVENKHVDCLQYRCPLCRASKVTRLAYESHLRRGHNAKVDQHSPLIKCKKKFCVKSEAQSSQHHDSSETRHQQYDLEFVTFLRTHLSPSSPSVDQSQSRTAGSDQLEQRSDNINQSESRIVSWVDQDQGIFKITDRDVFSQQWFAFKGLGQGSWSDLYESVILEFINRKIFKQISTSDPIVFQVFCIKQLLK